MNSIIVTHFTVPEDSTDALYIGIHRLSAWMDAEMETLGTVLAQSSRHSASAALNDLAQLHLEPDAGSAELREMLEHAQAALDYILRELLHVSCRQGTVSAWGLPGRDAFDTHVRWSAARLRDIDATIRFSLKA